MPHIHAGVVRASSTAHRSAPRTILGFAGSVLAILLFGGAAIVWAVAESTSSGYLVPVVVGVVLFVGVVIIAAVMYTAYKDPTRLMLGEVSAHDFLEYQRWITLGDSVSGETQEQIIELVQPQREIGPAAETPPPPTSEEEE